MTLKQTKLDSSLLTLLSMLGFILLAMAIVMPGKFYSLSNVQSMIYQFPEFAVMSFGVMICMISGGIDLSVLGIANLAGVIAAKVMLGMGNTTLSIVIAIVCALVVGVLAGLWNGFLIGSIKLPPMLVTLCGLQLFTGLALGITKGPALNNLPDSYKLIANGKVGEVPVVLFLFLLVLLFVVFTLRSTIFGRQVYFMGSNEMAAAYSGINVLKTTLKTYAFSGFLSAIAGIIMTSHFNSAKADYGSNYTLLTILIVVLGGIHPNGGKGKVSGVVIAIFIVQLITQIFSLMKIDNNFRTSTYGLLLVGSLVLTMLQDRLREKKAYRKTLQSNG